MSKVFSIPGPKISSFGERMPELLSPTFRSLLMRHPVLLGDSSLNFNLFHILSHFHRNRGKSTSIFIRSFSLLPLMKARIKTAHNPCCAQVLSVVLKCQPKRLLCARVIQKNKHGKDFTVTLYITYNNNYIIYTLSIRET